MTEPVMYAVGALLICFTIATFFLSRIDAEIYPEDYEFKQDPFWILLSVMICGSVSAYYFFPEQYDTIKSYGYLDIILPFVFALLIYVFYLFGNNLLSSVVTIGSALAISFLQPYDFALFPNHLAPWLDKIVVAFILFMISKGLSLLNGLGAIASMQFICVSGLTCILAYMGVLPWILGVIGMVLGGTMLAFSFFSWPPEKLILSTPAFASLGFVMGCFMLYASVEFAEASMFIGISYLITELGIIFYNRVICNIRETYPFMLTSYFRISEGGVYELGVVQGVLKILVIDAVLAVTQIAAVERLALPVFAIAINLWVLSILSGDTKPEQLISISGWGKKVVKGIFVKNKKNNKNDKL